jgi:hypothetical protein
VFEVGEAGVADAHGADGREGGGLVLVCLGFHLAADDSGVSFLAVQPPDCYPASAGTTPLTRAWKCSAMPTVKCGDRPGRLYGTGVPIPPRFREAPQRPR